METAVADMIQKKQRVQNKPSIYPPVISNCFRHPGAFVNAQA